jgi:hypothetical protein
MPDFGGDSGYYSDDDDMTPTQRMESIISPDDEDDAATPSQPMASVISPQDDEDDASGTAAPSHPAIASQPPTATQTPGPAPAVRPTFTPGLQGPSATAQSAASMIGNAVSASQLPSMVPQSFSDITTSADQPDDAAVLNSLPSLNSRRSYEDAIRDFIEWSCSEPRLAFNRTVVTRYARLALVKSVDVNLAHGVGDGGEVVAGGDVDLAIADNR